MPASHPSNKRRFLGWLVVAGLLLLVAVVIWWRRPALTETEVRSVVVSTIQSEAPASFLVTGTLDVTATATVKNTKYLFPESLNLDLGTTQATVRLPGRVAYGFDVTALRPEDIRIAEDGVVEVQVPALHVFSAEPDLARMEVQTEVGWARTYAGSGQQATQRAMRFAQEALRQQGAKHLETQTQPRVNTAEALKNMLAPALQAAGMTAPRFRIEVGPRLVMQPDG